MSRNSAYRLRARHGGELARLWDEGLAMGAALRRERNLARLRDLAARRRTGGWRQEATDRGKVTVPVQGDASGAR